MFARGILFVLLLVGLRRLSDCILSQPQWSLACRFR
jgi:hypothetical protein